MKAFVLFFFLLAACTAVAQNRCATSLYLQTVPSALQETSAKSTKEPSRPNAIVQKRVAEDDIIRIPVVVHILYNQSSQNISDAQIRSGLDALNRDFRRKNADRINTPQQFSDLAADIHIEFFLAKADPFGRATTGVERKQTTRNGWMADDKIKLASQGGLNAWDSKSYLNIWIGNILGGSGYSSVPGSAGQTDGIVIHYAAFGTINTAAPFNMGRTAVHEAGHWLGLKHIWGDSQCGDDEVSDTPKQGFFTQGCPTGFRSSCANGPTGDMYMNYMDYTNDACMNLFTAGQRTRMRDNFNEGGPRASLLQSKGLSEPWITKAPPVTEAAVSPNPAIDKLTIQVNTSMLGKSLVLLTTNGQVRKQLLLQAPQQTVDIADLKPGVYFLRCEGFMQKFIKL